MVGLVQGTSKLRRILLLLETATLLLVVGCASSSVQQKSEFGQSEADAAIVRFRPRPKTERSYPAWFWNMPSSEDSLFAVGLSETFAHAETAEQHAIEDGVTSLARALSVHVKGEYGMISDRGRPMLPGSDVQVEISPTMRAFVEKHHQVVAKHVSPTHTFVLLRLGEKGAAIPVSSIASAALPREPDWVTSLPKKPGYLYASGQSNPYYRETTSWSEAEKRARMELALILESKVWGLIKKERTHRQILEDSTVIDVSTDVQLSNTQVVARWKHPEHHFYNVLVRMPLSANIEAITNLVGSALAEDTQEQPSERPQEEIIQELFDELDQLAK
jgi:hypothetical protein